MEFSEEKINNCKMQLIFIERKNIRSREKSDVAMVKEIKKIVANCLAERY